MAGFGAKPVIEQQPGFGAKPVLLQQPGFGATPIIMQQPGFGAEPIIFQQPGFGAEPVILQGCFPKTELVNSNSNKKIPIGSLCAGDIICSWDVIHNKIQETVVTGIHEYKVSEIICFNNVMRVSATHPLMVMETGKYGTLTPKWKIAFDICIGDFVVGINGRLININSKSSNWYDACTDVLNLSTDNGVPFLVSNCVVRAENAKDNFEWANSPGTKELNVA